MQYKGKRKGRLVEIFISLIIVGLGMYCVSKTLYCLCIYSDMERQTYDTLKQDRENIGKVAVNIRGDNYQRLLGPEVHILITVLML